MTNAVYTLAIVQFFLGVIIAVINIIVLAATIGNKKLRSGKYLLEANFWFANIFLGVIIAISNVGDTPGRVALQVIFQAFACQKPSLEPHFRL